VIPGQRPASEISSWRLPFGLSLPISHSMIFLSNVALERGGLQ